MKKTILVIGLITIMLAAGLLGGCYRATEDNGKLSTKTFDYTDFTGIEVLDDFDLEITYADHYSITISGTDKAMNRLEVTKTGDTLKISLGGWKWFWLWHNSPKAVITLPVLRSLEVGGASSGFVSGFKSANDFSLRLSGASRLDLEMETGDFTSKISGASDLDIDLVADSFKADVSGASTLKGSLETGKTDIELSGASDVRLAGSGTDLILYASGASGARLTGFSVVNADVTLSGASDANIDVSVKLDINISGASSLDYYGEPSLGKTQISGSSDLNHKQP